jgi:HK97 family phage prohead protease
MACVDMAYRRGLDYETASHIGDIEYSDSGYITAIDHRAVKHVVPRKAASRYEPKVIEGFSVLHLKPHYHRNRIEVHQQGCFDETLATKARVDFCIDHDRSYSLGNTDDNLELIDTPKGLAFRLRVRSQEDLDRLQGRTAMSIRYAERDFEIRKINGEDVRFIKSAELVEVSAVFQGAVPKTHLIVRDAKAVGSFRDDCRWGFASDGAFVALQRALAKLEAS